MTTPSTSTADQMEIIRLVEGERAARDRGMWDVLLDSYHPDARITLSWYDGDAEGFVDGSRRMFEGGSPSVHLVGFPDLQLEGDRAIADTGCTINLRSEIHGVLADTVSMARHRSRVERRDGVWRLASFYAVYQRDSIAPVIPGDVPAIDRDLLASFRPSYMYLSYMLRLKGVEISPDLPGVDRRDALNALVTADEAWLYGRENIL